MRLTSLTLHGFKSFGDRTTVEFSPGVTAIVGPNGSGKSNLIEALRWATGGGRASEYRAGEKTDLIFHGARGKRSVSYAEVAIELHDGQRSRRITRSLLRDGSGKLKLDGKNARFLDLEDALSGSGLGRGSLAVIGQGEVGQVLMASPEKLLEYVAEAAGVAKLRGRREQALARLEAARDNLLRLEDLLTGLQAQVAQLRDEAAQAARHRDLSAEGLRLRYTLALGRRRSLETEVGKLGVERAELSEVLSMGREAHQEAQRRWHVARSEAAGLEKTYRELLAATEARRGDVRVAAERVSGLKERYRALEREAATLEQERARLQNLSEPLPPGDALATLQEAVDEAEGTHRNHKLALADVEAALEKKRSALETLKNRQVRDEQARATYEATLEGLEDQRAALEVRLSELGPADEDDLEMLSTALDALKDRRVETERDYSEKAARVAHLQQAHAEAHAEAQALTRAAERSRQAFAARRGYAQGPKHALSAGIAGVYGSVADLIRIPEAYRAALSSALGRRAEYIVVDTAETAQQVLAHVKRSGGWVTALPLDLVQGRSPSHSLAGEDGVVGLAAELIETSAQFRPVFHQLLGATTVVETLEGAVALSRKRSKRPRLVSLEGDIVESYGALSGGQSRGTSPVIGAASEVEEAEASAAEAAEQVAAVASELGAAQASARTAQAKVTEVVARLSEGQTALAEAREARAAKASLRQELGDRLLDLAGRLETLTPPQSAFDAGALAGAESELALLTERLERVKRGEASAAERYREASRAHARAEERWQRFAQEQARYKNEQEHVQTLGMKQRDLEALKLTVKQQLETAEDALVEAQAAVPTDTADKEAAWRAAGAESEALEAALTPLSEAQAERAERLETVKITLARRESALDLALEEERRFPEGLAPVEASLRSCRERLAEVEGALEALGPVNHRAAQDLDQEAARLENLLMQMAQADSAASDLAAALERIDQETTARLTAATDSLRKHFQSFAATLFGGDALADVLMLRDEGRPTGLKISLQPPGKQTQALNLLSVGERTMGALAFLFALTQSDDNRGLPLAVLDEVDAPLDEANIRRYCSFLEKLSTQGTQFVLITHQKATFEVADVLWGVTSDQGVSRLFSISKAETEASFA